LLIRVPTLTDYPYISNSNVAHVVGDIKALLLLSHSLSPPSPSLPLFSSISLFLSLPLPLFFSPSFSLSKGALNFRRKVYANS